MRTIHALSTAIALASTPTLAADRTDGRSFDLQCKGIQHRWTGGVPDAWSDRFRIDLASRRWCRGECLTAAPIAEAGPDRLRMTDSRGSAPPAGAEMTISRVDGSVLERVKLGPDSAWATLVEGFCQKDRFSGFGKPKF